MKIEKLKEPFPVNDIEWRIQQSGLYNDNPWGICLAYISNRAIMDRLDEIVGAENWTNEFSKSPNGGVLCRIGIRFKDEWVFKSDGAENTDIEAVKGGLSNSMKRAGVQWGIGRYLYKLPSTFATFTESGRYKAKIQNRTYKWNPPKLSDIGSEFVPLKTTKEKE